MGKKTGKKKTQTMNETSFNEHKADVPDTEVAKTVEKPAYPGYEYVGTKDGVVYLQNKNGVYCMKGDRLIRMGRSFSKELLESLRLAKEQKE